MDCVFQVYDNGIFEGSYGNAIDGMTFQETALVYDHNINKYTLANYWSRMVALRGAASLEDAYSQDESSYWGITVSSSTTEKTTICINGKEATEQELYDYMNQVEFISDPEEKENILNQFKEIITIY